jgi:hypothetical protein
MTVYCLLLTIHCYIVQRQPLCYVTCWRQWKSPVTVGMLLLFFGNMPTFAIELSYNNWVSMPVKVRFWPYSRSWNVAVDSKIKHAMLDKDMQSVGMQNTGLRSVWACIAWAFTAWICLARACIRHGISSHVKQIFGAHLRNNVTVFYNCHWVIYLQIINGAWMKI